MTGIKLCTYDPNQDLRQIGAQASGLGTVKSLHLSSEALQHLLTKDPDFRYVLDPCTSKDELEQGFVGVMYGVTVTTDAYDTPESRREKLPGMTYLLFYTDKETS